MKSGMLLLGLAFLLCGNSTAQAEVITFDTVPAGGANTTVFGTISADGFVFTSPHAHVLNSPSTCAGGCADNGTPWIGGDTTLISMRLSEPGVFSISALDAAEAFTELNRPTGLVVNGIQSDGRTLTALFGFDGINDSLGGQQDFQTFTFTNDWTRLVRLSFTTTESRWFGLDNLVVTGPAAPIPEPATMLLAGIGIAGALLRRRRIQRFTI